jgi:putative acetyltransferase
VSAKTNKKLRMEVRAASYADLSALEAVHRQAFSSDLEARLVRLLIKRGKAVISLAAAFKGDVVGHILFSPVTCQTNDAVAAGLGLAPLAVLPEFQRRGIGSALVRAGLEECQRGGAPWVVVLGDPGYYGRFGFMPASHFGVTGEFGGESAFQILLFTGQQAPGPGGHVLYAAEFSEITSGPG